MSRSMASRAACNVIPWWGFAPATVDEPEPFGTPRVTSIGKSSGRISASRRRIISRSMKFFSSRMFPGQAYASKIRANERMAPLGSHLAERADAERAAQSGVRKPSYAPDAANDGPEEVRGVRRRVDGVQPERRSPGTRYRKGPMGIEFAPPESLSAARRRPPNDQSLPRSALPWAQQVLSVARQRDLDLR